MWNLYHALLGQPVVPPKQKSSFNARWKAVLFLSERRAQKGWQTEKRHTNPRPVVKALTGFDSRDALALRGGTGSVTQREVQHLLTHQQCSRNTSSCAPVFQIMITAACLLHANTVFEILAYSRSRSILTWQCLLMRNDSHEAGRRIYYTQWVIWSHRQGKEEETI